jgi:hypothetical protein
MVESALFREVPCRYFIKIGPVNTAAALEAANQRAKDLGIRKIVVATNSGKTAYEALRLCDPALKIIAVSRVAGYVEANVLELSEADRQALKEKGADVVTSAHAFGGVGRAVRNKLGTYQVDEIMANVLKLFGRGTKVAIEVALMAADAGYVRTDEDIVSVGGSGGGADTALVLRPSISSNLFDLQVKEVICKPANL